MFDARQTICWGALPRRQRRLSRSSFGSQGRPLLLTAVCCAAVAAAYLGLAPLA